VRHADPEVLLVEMPYAVTLRGPGLETAVLERQGMPETTWDTVDAILKRWAKRLPGWESIEVRAFFYSGSITLVLHLCPESTKRYSAHGAFVDILLDGPPIGQL